jgi:SAM-dependent methyltransferase
MEKFFASGEQIVAGLVDDAPVSPVRREVAVEIGSGLGRICLALAKRYDRVIGIDISPEMVNRARQLVVDPRVTFQLGSGVGVDGVDDGCADLVLSFTVLQHIPKARIVHAYLADAARVLRPGGLLVFQWNNQPGSARWAVKRAFLSALQRTGIRREPFRLHAAEFLGTRVPITSIRRTLERSGLELRGTTGLSTLFAAAWAVRAP